MRHSTEFPAPKPTAGSASNETGALPGSFSVTPRGTPHYTIPIAVPPGRGSIHPHLSLLHTGDMGNGILGQGWALGGLSRIERCPKTIAQNGVTKQVALAADDALCLDGQRLVLDSGNASAPVHKYHTEIESFQLIQSFGTELNGNNAYIGPDSFKVWTKSGQILTYGQTTTYGPSGQSTNVSDSIVQTQGVNRVWNLSKVEDHAGNYMVIHYQAFNSTESNGTSEILPVSIYYDGQASSTEVTAGSTLPATLSVSLEYETRPDPRHAYVLGEWTYSTMRLRSIQTSVENQVVQSYNIAYGDVGNGESRVNTVQQCAAVGGAPTCIPWTAFGYFPAGGGSLAVYAPIEAPCGNGSTPCSTEAIVAVLDADGDGADDLLVYSNGKYLLQVKHANVNNGASDGFQTIDVTSQVKGVIDNITNGADNTTAYNSSPTVLDVNDDGLDDIVIQTVIWFQGAIKTSWTDILQSTGSGFQTTSRSSNCKNPAAFLGDFDGDGRKDYLCCDDQVNHSLYIQRGLGAIGGLNANEIAIAFPGTCANLTLLDRDRDGTDDVLVFEQASMPKVLTKASGPITQGGTDYAWVDAGFDVSPPLSVALNCSLPPNVPAAACTFPAQAALNYFNVPTNSQQVKIADVNGDGLRDIINYQDNPRVLALWLNTGRGFRASSVTIPTGTQFSAAFPLVYDYDNDGRDDLVDPINGFMFRGSNYGTLEWKSIAENFGGQFSPNTNYSADKIRQADLDGDGKSDWVVSAVWQSPNVAERIGHVAEYAVRWRST